MQSGLKIQFHPNKSLLVALLRRLAGLFPLTLQGIITLVLTAYALRVYGYGSMDLVVFSLAICALAILIFSLFCCVISGIFIQRRIRTSLKKMARVEPIKVEAGYPNETGFTLPALNYFPLIKLSWKMTYPDHVETRIRVSPDGDLVEEIVPDKRCKTDRVTRQFSVSDVLGFCRYSWLQKQDISCTRSEERRGAAKNQHGEASATAALTDRRGWHTQSLRRSRW